MVAFISGRSGEGKSSLAESFLQPLRLSDDMLVLTGRCYDRESVPFKAVDTVIEGLTGYLRRMSDAWVRPLLPEDIAPLVHLFPVLTRVPAISEVPTLGMKEIDGEILRRRAFAAFNDLVTRLSQPLEEVIDRRLKRLPPDASELLKVIAISGQALDADEASRASGLPQVALATLTHMRSERLVRLIGSAENARVDTYHDKIRESQLARLDSTRRRKLHETLAETILDIERGRATDSERRRDDALEGTGRVFDLAYHFFEAGDDRAFAYQLEAAERSAQAYALEDAQGYFARAESRLPNNLPALTRFRLYEGMAQVLLRRKDVESGLSYFEKALPDATSGIQRAGVQRVRIGGTLRKVGMNATS